MEGVSIFVSCVTFSLALFQVFSIFVSCTVHVSASLFIFWPPNCAFSTRWTVSRDNDRQLIGA